MATCAACGQTIVFGGVTKGKKRYCNQDCHHAATAIRYAELVPDDIAADRTHEVHQGSCPKCKGPGPVDIHTSHYIWSAIVLTSWYSTPEICCRSCGIKAKLGAAMLCMLIGWWGFPGGLIGTPIQILRNLFGVLFMPDSKKPSAGLEAMVRLGQGRPTMVEPTRAPTRQSPEETRDAGNAIETRDAGEDGDAANALANMDNEW